MDIGTQLKARKKKTINLSELKILLHAGSDAELYSWVSDAIAKSYISPVKASGTNGNKLHPLFLKYRIVIAEDYSEAIDEISLLHPSITKSGYLQSKPELYLKYKEQLKKLNSFLFTKKEYLYWGDIDRAGLNIYLSLLKNNRELDIKLFTPAYVAMLELSKNYIIPNSADHRKHFGNYDAIYELFTDTAAEQLRKTIEANKRIPQEIISYEYNDGKRLIADELFDFEGKNKLPSDVLINLANGGGKSVLVQLMMQPIIPRAKVAGRRIESFFKKATDHCYIVLEWLPDNSKMKLMTGIAMSASDTLGNSDSDRGFQIKYYTFISEYQNYQGNYNIVTLPLSRKENGKYIPAAFDEVRNLAKKIKRRVRAVCFG